MTGPTVPNWPEGQRQKGWECEARWVGLGRGETEGAAAKHGGGETGHHWLRLDVEVAIHLVRAPATDQANAIAINAGAHEGHRTASASGAGRDVGSGVDGVGMQDQRGTNARGYVRGEDIVERRLRAWADRIDWSGGGGSGAETPQ